MLQTNYSTISSVPIKVTKVVSMSLCVYVSLSLYLCIAPLSLPNLTKPQICLPTNLLTHLPLPLSNPLPPLSLSHPSLSHTPPSLFPDKKFPVEAHFRLVKLFYYIRLVGLPGFAQDFYCQLCIFVCLSISLSLPSIPPKPNLKYPAC